MCHWNGSKREKSDKLQILKIDPKKLPDHIPFSSVNSLLKGRNMLSVSSSLGDMEAKNMVLLSGGVEPDLYL